MLMDAPRRVALISEMVAATGSASNGIEMMINRKNPISSRYGSLMRNNRNTNFAGQMFTKLRKFEIGCFMPERVNNYSDICTHEQFGSSAKSQSTYTKGTK